MARAIVTWCDVHLDKGDQVDAQPWQFTVVEPGSRARTYELDLCGDCGGQLGALFASVVEHARLVTGKRQRETPAPAPTPAPASSSASPLSPGPVSCPLCDATPVSTGALDSHLRDKHESSIAEQNGTATLECPVSGCGRKLVNKVGLTAHVRSRHADYYRDHFVVRLST